MTIEDWKRIIKKWGNSGISQKEFCKQQRISYSSFKYWRKRITKILVFPAFKEIEIVKKKPAISANQKLPININLPGNITISIPLNLEEQTILLLVKLLKGIANA